VSDADLSRRDFLERTAYTAGLAGMAGSLPAGTLLFEAAEAEAKRTRLPSPRNIEIDHFVILMMENRSFDHYMGWVPDADGIQKQAFRDGQGRVVPTRPADDLGRARFQGCGHPDPGHGWGQGRAQLRGGFLAPGSGNDEFALSYYKRGELGFIHEAARKYTLYDRYFASLLGPTFPNRYYKWAATSAGKTANIEQVDVAAGGNQFETIFDRAIKRGRSARYYYSDLAFAATYGPRGVAWSNPMTRYYTDCAAGTLPNISIVDPPFKDGGGGDGTSADEHPLGDVRLGQAFMADVVTAFVQSPNYRRGALFILYDEWGGFFDHVRPPRVPDKRQSRDLDKDFGQMGFRVPAVTVSPYTRGKKGRKRFRVDHGTYGHESILKLISYRFGLGSLTKRQRYARNIGRGFDWDHPDFERPALPNPPDVASAPCASGGAASVQDSGDSHASDLDGLEALAHRFRYPVLDARTDDLFTHPSAVRRALGRR
jgi:phospholipase C